MNVSVASEASPVDAAHALILSSVSSAMTNGYHICAAVLPVEMVYKLGMEVTIREIVLGQNREKFYLWHELLKGHNPYHLFANTGISH